MKKCNHGARALHLPNNYLLSIYYVQDAEVQWLVEVLTLNVYRSVGEKDINLIVPGSTQVRKISTVLLGQNSEGQAGIDQRTRWDFTHDTLLLQHVHANLRIKSNLLS